MKNNDILSQLKRKEDSDSDYGGYDEESYTDSHLRINLS